jgi:hypothetical protein
MIGFHNHEWLLTIFTPKGQFYWINHSFLASNYDDYPRPRLRSIDTILRPNPNPHNSHPAENQGQGQLKEDSRSN